jgi:uncharacterized protein YdaL
MKWLLVLLALSASARAAQVDMNTQTCQDWIDAGEDEQDLMVAWLRGNIAGHASTGLYDMTASRADAAQLKTYCQQHLATGLLSAAGQLKK